MAEGLERVRVSAAELRDMVAAQARAAAAGRAGEEPGEGFKERDSRFGARDPRSSRPKGAGGGRGAGAASSPPVAVVRERGGRGRGPAAAWAPVPLSVRLSVPVSVCPAP